MRDRGTAVEQVDDRTFHRHVPACGICEANGLVQLVDAPHCVDCAESLDAWALYPAIHDAVRNITNSKLYTDNGPNGLIIAQGRHVLTDAILLEDAQYSIWLDHDVDICKIRYLNNRKKWDLPPDANEGEMALAVRVKESLNDSKLWARFQHYDEPARDQSATSSHIIDVGVKTADRVTQVAYNIVTPNHLHQRVHPRQRRPQRQRLLRWELRKGARHDECTQATASNTTAAPG